METRTVIKQVALSLFARRKKWIVLTTLAALVLLVPAAYVLSKEPPRYRTTATILIENKAGREPVFQEFTPNRPLAVQLVILQSRLLAASVVEALPKASARGPAPQSLRPGLPRRPEDWVGRLRGQEPCRSHPAAAGRLGAAPGPREVHQRGRRAPASSRSPRRPPSPRSRSTSPTPTSRCCWPAPVPSTSMTRRAPGSTSPSKRSRSRTLSPGARPRCGQFTMARGGVQIPAQSAETAQRLSQLETTVAEVQANKNISQSRLATLRKKFDDHAGRAVREQVGAHHPGGAPGQPGRCAAAARQARQPRRPRWSRPRPGTPRSTRESAPSRSRSAKSSASSGTRSRSRSPPAAALGRQRGGRRRPRRVRGDGGGPRDLGGCR